MTTIIPVQFSQLQVPQFQVTLDGASYNLSMPYNLYGQRYYVNCSDLQGNLIFSLPLVGSPPGMVIQTLSWDQGKVTLQTSAPHNYRPGSLLEFTLSGAAPDEYNGTYDMVALDRSTLRYSLAQDPGVSNAQGTLFNDLNLAAGYFETSSLVWRPSSSQLEVTP